MRAGENKARVRRGTAFTVAAACVLTWSIGNAGVLAAPAADGDPAQASASGTSFTGGIRDKSGAVEQDAQKASDLPAGSCVVSKSTPKGSQAGFSWYNSEPSATSPSKTRWGLSVAFDNSKDRTFADWGFTNNGKMGAYLDAAQIPAMDAGQTLVDKTVTHKADEILGITASGPQRPLNLNAKLTDTKVKQFAG